ncbi:putative lipoprotein [Labilithrix luteola]|uniref:Putative lipoprotein n=1 Tax=Labilithrix luteola TaxID=1391654 RepID=A0A0K1Q5F7_9BACT|nr:hypothetical protein [Labilithrix luteola]AKV00887.1 putative lipoprotein [Labilithrix luteola]
MRVSPSAIFVVIAMAFVSGVGIAAKSAPAATTDSSDLPSDAERVGFVRAGDENGVMALEATQRFELALGNGPVHGEPPPKEALGTARRVLARELARYPKNFLHAVRLRGVVLVSTLLEGDNPIPSLPNVGGLMLLDVHGAEIDLVRAIHHEIFHFADLADDGKLAPDPSWESLNREGFAYGAGGRTLRSTWAARPTDLAGFVSAYATSGAEEDKAETFAFAVARGDVVRARLGSDPVLASKMRELARRVASLDPEAPSKLGF